MPSPCVAVLCCLSCDVLCLLQEFIIVSFIVHPNCTSIIHHYCCYPFLLIECMFEVIYSLHIVLKVILLAFSFAQLVK